MIKSKKKNKYVISLIVPIFNEQDIISLFLEESIKLVKDNNKVNFEILLIDNGSKDNTPQIIKKFSKFKFFKFIQLTNYFGKENAILCGLDSFKGDYAVIIDPDLEDPIDLIPSMFDKITEGYDIVYGKRINDNSTQNFVGILKKLFYKIFAFLSDSNLKIYPNTGDFKILTREAAKNITLMRESTRFNRALATMVDMNVAHIEFKRKIRVRGKSKSNFKFLWSYGLNSIISSSSRPLEIWFYVGILWFIVSLALAIFVFFVKIYGKSIDGWSSTLLILLFFSSFNTLSIGIISIYLNRIYLEVKNRPNYIVRKNKNEMY